MRAVGAGTGEPGLVKGTPFAVHHCRAIATPRLTGFGHPVFREVEEIVHRHFGLEQPLLDGPAELAGLAGGNPAVVFGDPLPDREEVGVGRRLDDLEVLIDETITPFVAGTDGPDRPDFVGAASDGFLEVGVGDVYGVDVGVAGDLHRGNHIGSDTAAIRWSSVIRSLVTTSSRFFEKLKRLNVPRRAPGPNLREVDAPKAAGRVHGTGRT